MATNKESGNQQANNPQNQNRPPGLKDVSNIIAIASGKGGVGKSTVSANLAMALVKKGYKVGLMDADIYGPSQPAMLGAGKEKPQIVGEFLLPLEKHGIHFMSIGILMDEDQPVIWRAPMATKMIQQFLGNVKWGELDYLLVDLPPGTGDVQLTLAQQAHLTGAVIVTTPQQVALGVARKGLQMFQTVKVPIIGIIENMSGFKCSHCGEHTDIFHTGGGQEMAKREKLDFLGGIPLDPAIVKSGDDGIPILQNNTDSEAAKSFLNIADNFIKQLSKEAAEGSAYEPEKVELTDNNQLAITWPDGKRVEYSPYDLRLNCRCAVCISEDTGEKLLDPASIPLDIKIEKFDIIGRYALGIAFSDRHDSGIFAFDKLHEIEQNRRDIDKQKFNV